jgi:hypothetical protein
MEFKSNGTAGTDSFQVRVSCAFAETAGYILAEFTLQIPYLQALFLVARLYHSAQEGVLPLLITHIMSTSKRDACMLVGMEQAQRWSASEWHPQDIKERNAEYRLGRTSAHH